MEKGISVIICCYNSASRLSETLQHLALQKTEVLSWEIVLVDNASKDNTKEAARKFWKQYDRKDVPLKIVDQQVQGLSFARKKGIDSSMYDVIIFCDDDNWLEQNYLQDAYYVLESNIEIGAVGGTGTAVTDGILPYWFDRYRGCFACYPQGERDGELEGVGSALYGAGLAVKKEVLRKLSLLEFQLILPDRVGSKLISGGDTELSYAIRLIGYKLWFSEKLRFSHYLTDLRLTEKYLIKLIGSLSYCSGILIVYNYVLSGKKVNRSIWLKDATYQLVFFFRSLLRYPFGSNSLLEKRLDIAFAYNRMRSVFHQVTLYQTRYKQVMRLKKSN